MKVSISAIQYAYKIAKRHYDGTISFTEAYSLISAETGMAVNSAKDYVNNLKYTKVILYAHKEYAKMSKDDRYRACYLHACLKRVNREVMTNSSLRERFNIDAKNSSMITRLLNETCAAGLIKISPDSTSDKNRKYLPFWA